MTLCLVANVGTCQYTLKQLSLSKERISFALRCEFGTITVLLILLSPATSVARRLTANLDLPPSSVVSSQLVLVRDAFVKPDTAQPVQHRNQRKHEPSVCTSSVSR